MNKLILYVVLILVALSLSSCSQFESRATPPIEMVAFNNLSDEEKDLIPVSPKDSTVEKVPVSYEIRGIIGKNYDEQQVYAVTFNRTATDTSGNLVVYVALDEITVVGKGLNSK